MGERECVLNRWLLWLVRNVILRHVYSPMLQTEHNHGNTVIHIRRTNKCLLTVLRWSTIFSCISWFFSSTGIWFFLYSLNTLCNIICVHVFSMCGMVIVHIICTGISFPDAVMLGSNRVHYK